MRAQLGETRVDRDDLGAAFHEVDDRMPKEAVGARHVFEDIRRQLDKLAEAHFAKETARV